MKIRRRILYLILIVFLVASLGCRNRFRVSKSPPIPHPQGDYYKFAHIIIDVCDPECSQLLKLGSGFEGFVYSSCAAGMKKMEKDLILGRIRNPKLAELIKKYSDGFKSSKED